MPQLVDPAALAALVPPNAISFALEHREQLSALLASTDDEAADRQVAAGAMDPTAVEAFRLSYQSAFEEALRQSLPTAPPRDGLRPQPQPEPEPEPGPAGLPAKGQPWPTVRPANWPDSKKAVTDDSRPAVDGHASAPTGPKPNTVLWTSRDRRAEVTEPSPNTWGAAEEPPEVMLKTLRTLGPAGVDARDENGWTALMWSARLNRQANVCALLREGATASLRSSKDVWRFPSNKTASQLARIASEWDNQDRTELCVLLEAAESDEARSRVLQDAYNARSEQVKAEHAANKKDAVFVPVDDTADEAEAVVASKVKWRTLLREAEAGRIQAEAKAKRVARAAGTAQAELEALRAEHERYRVGKEKELAKAREELLDLTVKARSAELRKAHGL